MDESNKNKVILISNNDALQKFFSLIFREFCLNKMSNFLI